MSLLICTPCYASAVTSPFLRSCIALEGALTEAGLDHDWLITDNESLIQRARNTTASTFLKTDFKKMLFIDSDIEFKPDHVASLWNLDEKVAVGLYPMKRKDAPLSAWVNGELVTEMPDEPFEVDYAGTGFMMIDRDVLEDMKGICPDHEEGKVGDCWAFFNPRVEDGVYLSEDYAFCYDYRSIGGKIISDPSIKLKHYGMYGYG